MRSHFDVVIQPVLTEKGTRLSEKENKYLFKVYKHANKIEIRHAIEKFYNVKVLSVNTLMRRSKNKRVRYKEGKTPEWKKAIVTLGKGNKIELV